MSQKVTIFNSSHLTKVINDVVNATESAESRRVYRLDIQHFFLWMHDEEKDYQRMDESDALSYKSHLQEEFARATAQRMLSVIKLFFEKLQKRGMIAVDPFTEVKGFKLANESPHKALDKEQAKALLASINTKTPKGKRDYALISLLLRTGIRRSECAALNIGDLDMEKGHHIATIQHGKGDKRRTVKIPVDVFRSLEEYIEASGRTITSLNDPLFIGFDRRPEYEDRRISEKVIERVVVEHGKKIGFLPPKTLTPHDLRTSFITLSREGGATLEQRQFAAGHSDPRTTQRYDTRKLNLDDNAVDYIKL